MTLITCIDDRGGLAFHRRRLSRDRALCKRILELAGTGILRLSPYSLPLFEPLPHASALLAGEDYLADAAGEDLCFTERADLSPWLDRADKLVLFRWNRTYPFDLRFPLEELDRHWVLTGAVDFPGSSHEKITEEWYEKA